MERKIFRGKLEEVTKEASDWLGMKDDTFVRSSFDSKGRGDTRYFEVYGQRFATVIVEGLNSD